MGRKGRENPSRSSSPAGHNSRIRNRPHVPRDVWWDIFIFLPASSLVRLRAVCKAWRAVIDDPIFRRAHVQISSNNTILIGTSSTAPPLAPCYSVVLDALIPRDGLQTIPATPARPLLRILPDATCHGLVFEDFEIWNPFFGDRHKLPDGGFTLPDPDDDNVLVRGLGYDHATDDYKAVVIDCGPIFQPRLLTFPTFVYSLRSDSWRRIEDCPCGREGLEGRPGLFLSGALHWKSRDNEIIVLNLETEKYRKLQMPPFGEPPVEFIGRGRELDVLDGCLVVTEFCLVGKYSLKLDASVLERGSWMKLFSLCLRSNDRILSYLRPLAYIMKNKRHILMEDFGELYLVDTERETLKNVSISGLTAWNLCAQPFQESLFRPKDICGVVCGQQRKKMSSRDQKKSKTKRRVMEKYKTDLSFCVSDF